ncbi:MAG: hypothetical protein PUD22_04455 [Erysipelotrichaceae bacterium]|nr:hypothetical protein [Erysipelotrichaceae bacterium]
MSPRKKTSLSFDTSGHPGHFFITVKRAIDKDEINHGFKGFGSIALPQYLYRDLSAILSLSASASLILRGLMIR